MASLLTFAKNLGQRLDCILAHCRIPIHTSLIERVSNKIKLIKRIGHGYRTTPTPSSKFNLPSAEFPGEPEKWEGTKRSLVNPFL